MKDNKIEERKNMLREFFEDEKYKPMRYKDIVGLLQVPRESKHELKQVLDTLISEVLLSWTIREDTQDLETLSR